MVLSRENKRHCPTHTQADLPPLVTVSTHTQADLPPLVTVPTHTQADLPPLESDSKYVHTPFKTWSFHPIRSAEGIHPWPKNEALWPHMATTCIMIQMHFN